MTSKQKIQKLCALVGLRLCDPFFADVSVQAEGVSDPGIDLYSRYRDGVRSFQQVCDHALAAKSLTDFNNAIAKRQIGSLRADGTWVTCSGNSEMFKVTGRSKYALTNLKALARKAKKILA